MKSTEIIKIEEIQSKIMTIRNHQVMLDSDLAVYYGVETKRLNEQVKRNQERFPVEFCFQLNDIEVNSLKSQNATLETKVGIYNQNYVFLSKL